MDDELKWQAGRANLYRLKSLHPDYSLSQLAQALYRCGGYQTNPALSVLRNSLIAMV